MKVTMLKGIVSLEMSKEEAIALIIALKSIVWRMLDDHKKYQMLSSWDDLAAIGKVKDVLDAFLKSVPISE